jgi:putative hydrolase of the HAD superfamily
VVFDLFFTLINPLDPALIGESEYTLLGMDRGDFEGRYFAGYEEWGSGKIRDPLEIIARVLQGLEFSGETLRRVAEARMERIRRAFDRVEERHLALLRRLREGGYRTALVSNADVMDTRYWQESALASSFDETLFSWKLGLVKPDPRIFTLAAEKLKVKPAECLYLGDGGHRELEGARAAGMIPVLTTEYITALWPERIETLRRDAVRVIGALEEIEEILQ